MDDDIWIFGYGSLIWRPDFPFAESRTADIEGWTRRFWQGSTDHRGVPDAPGRVVTLLPEAETVCRGRAFRVAADARDRVMAQLDHREKGGYRIESVSLRFAQGAEHGLVYIATPGNPNYLGPAPLSDIAEQVRNAHGPSGANLEYVLRLAQVLREIGADDPHVFELADLLRGG